MINEVQSFYNAFLTWLSSKDALNDFFSWLIFAVVLGGAVAAARLIARIIKTRYQAARTYQEVYGTFFLYHPPLVQGISDLPRVSILEVRSGITEPVRVFQRNFHPRRLVYAGKLELHKSAYFLQMASPHGECPKGIVLWRFQTHRTQKFRVTVGAMLSTSGSEEPYRVPIVVSERPLSRHTVSTAFDILSDGVIRRSERAAAQELFDLDLSTETADEFEQYSGRRISVRPDQSRWIGLWAAFKEALDHRFCLSRHKETTDHLKKPEVK